MRAVFTTPHLGVNNTIKLHMMGVVTALPSVRFCEFTTGTTDIQRLHIQPAGPYMVSHTYPSAVVKQLPAANCTFMWST